MSGMARHDRSTRSRPPPSARRSASRMTSGPRVVNVPSACTPLVSSGSPSQKASAESARHTPLTTTSTRTLGSLRFTSDAWSPTWRLSAAAAASDRVVSRGSCPARAQAPSTRAACSSIPSRLSKLVRSRTWSEATAGSANEPVLTTRAISPPVAAIATWIDGRMAPSSPSISVVPDDMATTTVRLAGGAARIERWRPLLAIASPYTTPVARSVVAETRRSHAASTTGQSARLRWTTAPGRPESWDTSARFSRSSPTPSPLHTPPAALRVHLRRGWAFSVRGRPSASRGGPAVSPPRRIRIASARHRCRVAGSRRGARPRPMPRAERTT